MQSLTDIISRSVDVLLEGGTLLYPTDTIWGVGCDATNAAAVEKIYALKQRDHSKSMLILCADLAMVEQYVAAVDKQIACLLEGAGRATTVIMPIQHPGLAPNLQASDGTIGVRIPHMDFCLKLLRQFGRPIVSTSANLSGQPSPSAYSDINDALKTMVDYAIPPEYGNVSGGKASRIVKINCDGTLTVLRG